MAKSFALIPGGEIISLMPTPIFTTSSFRPWVMAIPTRLWSYDVWYPIMERALLAAATGLSFSTWCNCRRGKPGTGWSDMGSGHTKRTKRYTRLLYPVLPDGGDVVSPTRSWYSSMAHHEQGEEESHHLPCGRSGSRWSVILSGQYDAGRKDTDDRWYVLMVSGLFGAF